MNKIYTIGYATFQIDQFLDVIKKYKINVVVDVRSNPKSKYYTDFDEVNLKKTLEKNNIHYRNYKKEFGARQENSKYYTDGYLDFQKFTHSELFLNGVRKIELGMEKGYNFVLMCAEKDPSTCHRNIMVAREFWKKGYEIINILNDENVELQNQIEEKLVKHYFPNKDQMSLFDKEMTNEEMVIESYKRRNKEIGYRINSEEEEYNE